ncbi:DUF1310 domain-containing protein [Streptococcus sanguinis]|uniref:DUF1310 family protein n=1 Tax=Streptococcus sanguinis TaxID=1305 RepID=UPI001CBC3731|nr:DUF1310 family protein [Streptococcus sanguinis]MBZ2038323.1 DUF1310 domain-containing protein [Streptococcus sanguinis]MBZ2068804.1 DUF1310 domain-containing protein [Streptococcus sanguinis]MBZ2070706.1 DUF1310 domain-containing protein [Streptococcus sanguinis]
MSKRRNRIKGLIGLSVLILLGVGLYLAHKNQEFQNEMTRIVHSKKVKNLIEKKLKKLDSHALTDKGKIQSYKIDDRSIRHNPMGGIMFHVIINDDSDAVFKFGIRKYSQDGRMSLVGGTLTEKLQQLLEE